MLYSFFFLLLTYFILTHSDASLHYALYGFTLWYSKMIPSLLPFMILSGILVRMNLTGYFAKLLHPILKRLFWSKEQLSYGIIIGFLCGFPMGARTAAELFRSGSITRKEAQFLLSFCNNIGPVYFCSFVIPLLGISKPVPYLIGMYGIPLVYGMVLRRTVYRNLPKPNNHTVKATTQADDLLTATDESIQAAIRSILMLCGYMILFNILNLLPHFLIPKIHIYIAPLLEITGGLSMLGQNLPLYSLCILPFGGLSCIAQTNSMIKGTGLSIREYTLHKIILTILTLIYYSVCYPAGVIGNG